MIEITKSLTGKCTVIAFAVAMVMACTFTCSVAAEDLTATSEIVDEGIKVVITYTGDVNGLAVQLPKGSSAVSFGDESVQGGVRELEDSTVEICWAGIPASPVVFTYKPSSDEDAGAAKVIYRSSGDEKEALIN